MQLLLFSIVSQTSVHLFPPIFLRKRSRRPRLRDTSSIGMTRGLSILVPVSDKGNEGGPVLTFVVRGEYCTFSLARSLLPPPPPAHFPFPSSARSTHSFLSAYFLSLRLSPLRPSLIGSPPPRLASPRLASPRSAPLHLPFSLFHRLYASSNRYGIARLETGPVYIRVDAVRQGFGNDPLRTLIYIPKYTEDIPRIDTGSVFNRFRLLTYSDLSVCLALARGERERERDSISREEPAHRFVAFTRSDTDNNKREKEGGGEE